MRLADKKIRVALLCVMSFCFFIFVCVAHEVREGDRIRFDEQLLIAMRHLDNPVLTVGPSWLLQSAQDISALGGVTVVALFTAIMIGYYLLSKRWHAALFLGTSMAGAALCITLLKSFFARPRPELVPHLVAVTDASFPSGHSLISAVFYLTMGAMLARTTQDRTIRIYWMCLAIAIAITIGLSRVFLGVHYPSDVLAGWCAGTAWASGTYLLSVFRWTRSNSPEINPES